MSNILKNIGLPWSAEKIPSLTGKVAVITGGNEGIGAAFVTELFKHDISKVFILSNDAARHQEAVAHFNKESQKDVSNQVIFYKLDLGDYSAVKDAISKIKQNTDRIDIIDCNAAIGMYTTDVPTSTNDKKHAIDRHFAVNSVGQAIIIQELLPLIKKTADKSGDARIVIMASNLHFSAPEEVKFESINEINTDLGPTLQYNRSKLANVLYTKKLARVLQSEGYGDKIFVNCIHPGVVKTAQQAGAVESYQEVVKEKIGDNIIGNAAAAGINVVNHALRFLTEKDSPEGALSSLYAATSEEVKSRGLQGEYIVPNATIQEADKRSLDEAMQDRCYKLIQECIEKDLGNSYGADHQEGSTERGSATI